MRMSSRRLLSSVSVISARGDIDASNAEAVTEYALRHGTCGIGLILDLIGVNFFAAEGFSSAPHRISVNCARRATIWAIVPGTAAAPHSRDVRPGKARYPGQTPSAQRWPCVPISCSVARGSSGPARTLADDDVRSRDSVRHPWR